MTSEGRRYVRRTSFEIGDVDDWSVTESTVALLAGSTIHLVSDSVDTVELDGPARQVGLNDKLFVLFSEKVAAYSTSGTRLWTAEVENAVGVAAPVASDFVVVLTDDRLLGLDATAGYERFAVERPDSDVAAVPEIVCTDTSLVVAAWSFLTILEPTGATQLRTTLDGAIHGIGVVGDTVVCVMKDDRLLGIDVETGDEKWCHEWVVDRIDPFAHQELLVRTAEGIRMVDPDGEWHNPSLDDGLPIAAASGEPVCVVVDSLVNVYARTTGEADFDAAVPTDAIEPTASSLPVVVENVSDTPSVTTASVEADGATISTGAEQLALTPGERERIRVGIGSIRAEDVDVDVYLEDELVTSANVPVAGGVDALSVSTAPVAADADGWTVEVTVENTASVPVRQLALDPGDNVRESLESGETWVVTVPHPDEGEIVLSVADSKRRVEPSIPEHPLVAEVEFEEGLVVASVSNRTTARVVDTVRIASSAVAREFEHEFDGGPDSRLVVATPPVETGTATVTVSGRFVSARETVEIPPNSVPALGSGGATDANAGGQSRAVDSASPPTAEGQARGADAASRRTGRGDDEADSGGGGSRADAQGESRASGADAAFPLELDRRWDSELSNTASNERANAVTIGDVLFEYVDVANVGSEGTQVVLSSEDADTTEVVGPGESATFVRKHTFTEEGGRVPGVAVETPAGRRDADAVEPAIETPEWYCLAAVVPSADGPLLRLEIANRSQMRVQVADLSLPSFSFTESVGSFQVSPRSTVVETIPLSGPPAQELSEPELLSFSAGPDVGQQDEYRTLVALPSPDRGFQELDFEIDDETVLDAEGGTVVVRCRNTGTEPVENLSIEADGTQVREILYDALTLESLAAGDTVTHYVDVGDTADELDVSLSLATDAGRAETVQIRASDPEASAVEVARPQLPKPEDVSLPPRTSTKFSVEREEDA
ncbi:PQQ-binding-like beta-propeller repeat protein [Haloparvum sp. PAK95]|uniref:outer membrane protein assembly factor BamB family protein n=1 Tax=Haloparvum sp. PAK95 TaxID=3418962 RepID=UPI003D2F2BEB